MCYSLCYNTPTMLPATGNIGRCSVICGLHQIHYFRIRNAEVESCSLHGREKKAMKISTWNRVRKRQLRITTLEDNIKMDLNGKNYKK